MLSGGLVAVVAGGLLATRLGGEFIPRLDEGDLSVFAIRPSSVGISEVAAGTGRIERVLKRFPEVITVVSRSGSPELATDVMGIELGRRVRDAQAPVRVDDAPGPRGSWSRR